MATRADKRRRAPRGDDTSPAKSVKRDVAPVVVPERFMCIVCMDLLMRPVQFPCCSHPPLCSPCAARLADSTGHCFQCRKRIVSVWRKKRYTVLDALWAEIQSAFPAQAAARVAEVEAEAAAAAPNAPQELIWAPPPAATAAVASAAAQPTPPRVAPQPGELAKELQALARTEAARRAELEARDEAVATQLAERLARSGEEEAARRRRLAAAEAEDRRLAEALAAAPNQAARDILVSVSKLDRRRNTLHNAFARARARAPPRVVVTPAPAAAVVMDVSCDGAGGGDAAAALTDSDGDDGVRCLGSRAPVGALWSCSVCTLQNAADAQRCAACDAQRPPSEPDPQWSCTVCTLQNAAGADRCAACNTPKAV